MIQAKRQHVGIGFVDGRCASVDWEASWWEGIITPSIMSQELGDLNLLCREVPLEDQEEGRMVGGCQMHRQQALDKLTLSCAN